MFTRNVKLSHIYLAHYSGYTVSKQLHNNKQDDKTCKQPFKYDSNSDSTVKKTIGVIIQVKLVQFTE